MQRRQRTEILINGSREIPARLAQQIIDHYEVNTLEQPNNGLVMMKVRETSQKSLFYLGEVFVTESKVQIGQAMGLGLVKGHESELAYQLAVIDAAYQAGIEETKHWTEVLLAEEEVINHKKKAFQHKVLQTKVNFETMDDGN
ncbi:alpha-D-ribose 1-methylphosphonate 5-triphosphate synthase subunit PhnG [Paenibacillus sp. LBL]|uniref:phosphonate C-P lyase system protein PhnG n=1 Tax=Paenibacillus sp. LBL TaxID=2940563 RepID=UPI002475AF0A|nr:phosphonate C-P lyase system protein PhnG [Paenibacillus sp. LBL]MDH6670501.1 alpha-D-ribose 1-methylphosphonate 5-triphosphate synthase subunit PhnG [Paenibacillus sp. LBL]